MTILTELGKLLRKLRIDREERLLDLANAVNCTPAFISAVELGRKPPPMELMVAIVGHYKLEPAVAEQLYAAAAAERQAFTLRGTTVEQKETAEVLARAFPSLSSAQLQQIRAVIVAGGNRRKAGDMRR